MVGQAIHLELVIPDLLGDLVGRGITSYTGKTLEQVIGRFTGGPMQRAVSDAGTPERRYPITIPADDGLWLSLPTIGDVGFSNDQGQLRILCPAPGASWLLERLGARVRSTSPDGNTLIIWVHTHPGPLLSIPVLSLFSVRLQVPASRSR